MDILVELRGLRSKIVAVDRLEKHSATILQLEGLIREQFGPESHLLKEIEKGRRARFLSVGDVGWDSSVKHMQQVALQVSDAAIALLERKIQQDELIRSSENRIHANLDQAHESLAAAMSIPQAAVVCENGHLLATIATSELSRGFCSHCGAARLTSCGNCGSDIPGQTIAERDAGREFQIHSFCTSCGKPYVWTERRIAAIVEVAELAEKISDRERKILKESLAKILHDTPEAVPAAQKVKLIAVKGGKELASTILQLSIELAAQGAKQVLAGG